MSDPQERAEEPVRQVAVPAERAGVRATERGQDEAPGSNSYTTGRPSTLPGSAAIPSGETVRIVSAVTIGSIWSGRRNPADPAPNVAIASRLGPRRRQFVA